MFDLIKNEKKSLNQTSKNLVGYDENSIQSDCTTKFHSKLKEIIYFIVCKYSINSGNYENIQTNVFKQINKTIRIKSSNTKKEQEGIGG